MKKIVAFTALAFLLTLGQDLVAQAKYEFKLMTAIESVVPGGLGRSRLITTDPKGEIQEIKLENFFSFVGINFGNIKENDLTLAANIQKLSDEGWTLENTTSAVYGADKSTGIFITRYLFKREKK